jgi:hypothetical protein
MRVIYTEEALENLDGMLAYISSNYPTVYEAFQSRWHPMFLLPSFRVVYGPA